MKKFAKVIALASLAAASASPALAADTSSSTTKTNQIFYADFMDYLYTQMGYFSALNESLGYKSGDGKAVTMAFAKFMASEDKLYKFLDSLITKH